MVPVLPRGFKSWCENVALHQRKELGLGPADPLDPLLLAKCLGITVLAADQIPGLDPFSLKRLIKEDPSSWSALTLCHGHKHLIVLNPAHSPARRASDLTHEISHIMLAHKACRVDITDEGLLMRSNFDLRQEEEALWLSGALLLPRAVLVLLRRKNILPHLAARKYGVSGDMLDYRLRVTGVNIQLAREIRDNGSNPPDRRGVGTGDRLRAGL